MKGSTYKRCKCPVQHNAKGARINCRKDHGTWYYVADVGLGPDGKRKQARKGGFRTSDDAEKALTALLERVNGGQYSHDERQTVAAWLATWLERKSRGSLRQSTVRAYSGHIEQYLTPRLGRIRLQDLRPGHVHDLLLWLDDGKRKPATRRRIHATLCSALSTAVEDRLVTYNAAKVKLPKVERPKVKPWEPAELGTFLDFLGEHRLDALFATVAGTGLRRGEAVGLRWEDVDLDARTIVVRQQIVQEAGRQKNKRGAAPCPYCDAGHIGVSFGKPKTASGEDRVIDLDSDTAWTLSAHRERQAAERGAWGGAYADHGLVFAREDGNPLRPDETTKVFVSRVDAAGLRRIRLHDLRHGHASLMLAADVDVAIVSKRLGHSTLAMTVDTYSHLLNGVGRGAADRASGLIPRARQAAENAPAGDLRDHSVTTSPVDTLGEPVAGLDDTTFSQVSAVSAPRLSAHQF